MKKKKDNKEEFSLFQLLDLHRNFWKSTFSTLYGKTDVVGLDDKHRTIFCVVSEEGEMKDEKKLFDEHGNMYITDTCKSKEPILYLMLDEEQLKECEDELKEYAEFSEKYDDDKKEAVIFDDLFNYDFSKVKAFDKVLVRYNSGKWHTDIVDYVDRDEDGDIDIHLSFYAGSKRVEVAPFNKNTEKYAGKLAILPPGMIWVPKYYNEDEDDYDDYE